MGQELVGCAPDDRRDVAGQDERIDCDLGVVDKCLEGMGYGLMRGKHAEIVDTSELGTLDGRCDERGGGLETHAHEDNLAAGIFLCAAQAVEWRVDDADVATRGLLLVERGSGARHARHVTEGRDNDVIEVRKRDDGIDILVCRDADGAARTAHELDAVGKYAANARACERDRMRPADLHEPDLATALLERCRGNVLDDAYELLTELGVAESGKVEH